MVSLVDPGRKQRNPCHRHTLAICPAQVHKEKHSGSCENPPTGHSVQYETYWACLKTNGTKSQKCLLAFTDHFFVFVEPVIF